MLFSWKLKRKKQTAASLSTRICIYIFVNVSNLKTTSKMNRRNKKISGKDFAAAKHAEIDSTEFHSFRSHRTAVNETFPRRRIRQLSWSFDGDQFVCRHSYPDFNVQHLYQTQFLCLWPRPSIPLLQKVGEPPLGWTTKKASRFHDSVAEIKRFVISFGIYYNTWRGLNVRVELQKSRGIGRKFRENTSGNELCRG